MFRINYETPDLSGLREVYVDAKSYNEAERIAVDLAGPEGTVLELAVLDAASIPEFLTHSFTWTRRVEVFVATVRSEDTTLGAVLLRLPTVPRSTQLLSAS